MLGNVIYFQSVASDMIQYHFAFDEIITIYIFDYDTNSHNNELKYEMNENNSFIHSFFWSIFIKVVHEFYGQPLYIIYILNRTLIGICKYCREEIYQRM